MKIQLIIIALLSLLVTSCKLDCECCGCEGALFEANVFVFDMDGKPMVGKKIDISGGYGIFRTDKNGFLKFTSKWSADSYIEWKLLIVDSSDYKSVNFLKSPVTYTPVNEKVTIADTIRMDTLKRLTIRLKTSKSNVDRLFLSVLRESDSDSYGKVSQAVKRDFITLYKSASPQLDTTIQIEVYSKAAFKIRSEMVFKNPVSVVNRNLNILNFEKRDSILFEF
jgi:hypothetical protein